MTRRNVADLAVERAVNASAIWSAEAEQSVLGGLMLDPRAIDAVDSMLTPESFFDPRHGWAFSAAKALAAESKPVDPITVFEVLRGRKQVDDDFGLAYLNAMSESVPSAANIRRYAEIVAEKAAQRLLLAKTDEAFSIASGEGSAAEKLDRITAGFVELERGQQRRAPRLVSDLLADAIDRYESLADGKTTPGISTGIPPLDRLLSGGLKPGKVYGIAARPSVGKSSAARTILLHMARSGVRTLLLSQEMPADELADALIAESGRIDSAKLQTGEFGDEDWGRIVDATEELRSAPLHIDDQGGLTLAQIRAKARSVKGLQVVALDYLQLCTSTLRNKTTNDEIAEISKGLKRLALELGIPVIVLSQLSREVERRADKEPQLSDLRDSGAIEQDLDVAVMLWTAIETDESRLVGWKVAKHRGGRKGVFAMRWKPEINEWRESLESLKPTAAAQKSGGRWSGGFRE